MNKSYPTVRDFKAAAVADQGEPAITFNGAQVKAGDQPPIAYTSPSNAPTAGPVVTDDARVT